MVNHPNRRRLPFICHLIGSRLARFSNAEDTHEFALSYSLHHGTCVEIEGADGLVGQYKDGAPTVEFAGRSDAWFPAGPRKA